MYKKLKIIDLFAGIGGTRIGFEKAGFRSVFSSEIDKFARQTYYENFDETPEGDIKKIGSDEIPEFDVLVAGFPCQSFSIAGRKLGFRDTRGTLFFEIARIIKDKRPPAFMLENVKNLERHDKRRTMKVILNTLNELGYNRAYSVMNAKNFGLPQNRERVFVVGFRKDVYNGMIPFPAGKRKNVRLKDILERDVPLRYFLSKRRLQGMIIHKERHRLKGNGFGYGTLDIDGYAKAIVVGGMGRERNLVKDCESFHKHKKSPEWGDKNDECIRYLIPREFARLQGFDDSFKIPVSVSQAYRQFANSVPIPVVEAVARNMRKILENNLSV